MKTFLDLLAIEPVLEIEIQTSQASCLLRWPLLVPIDIACADVQSVTIDGMEVLDFGYRDQGMWRMTLHEPFYRWRHRVTGQGWLLEPIKSHVDLPLKTGG